MIIVSCYYLGVAPAGAVASPLWGSRCSVLRTCAFGAARRAPSAGPAAMQQLTNHSNFTTPDSPIKTEKYLNLHMLQRLVFNFRAQEFHTLF